MFFKLFVFAAVLAFAAATAKPGFLAGALPTSYIASAPLAYTNYAAAPSYGYAGYPYAYGSRIGAYYY